jgi:CHAT domain-containing protein
MKKLLTSLLFSLSFLVGHDIGEPAQRTGASQREGVSERKAGAALSEFEAKASEAESKQDWENAASAYYQASRVARLTGQLQKAVSYGTKAMEHGAKVRNPMVQARAAHVLGMAYRQLRQREKSTEIFEKGIEVSKEILQPVPKLNIQSSLYTELGTDFLRQGEIDKAIQFISYSIQLQEEQISFLTRIRRKVPIGQSIQATQSNVAASLIRLGGAYEKADKPGEAIKTYEKGLALIKETGLKVPAEGNLYQGLGRLYLSQKDFPRALENLKKSLEIGETVQSAHVIQQASSKMGDLLLQTNKPAEAIPFFARAIDGIESTRSGLESEEFRTSFFENKREIYAGMIFAQLGSRNMEEAFNYNERARSRALLDILGSKAQLTKGSALSEEERALQSRISALQTKMEEGENGEEEPAAIKDLKTELEAAQRAYKNLLAKIRHENKEQASLMNVEPLSLKQVQELLDPGVTVLAYFVPRGRAMVWVVEKDRVHFVRVPVGRKELISKVAALRDAIYKIEEKEKFKELSQELYRLLIEPALPHIKGKELLIIPHDVLHYLPYQALLSPGGRYLIQDYPVYYLSSASLMQFTREKRRAARGDKALVMANPSLGDVAYNLRFAEREAKEVANVYPQSAVFVRAEATKPKAVSLSPNYDMLHFAVHGELNEEDPLGSALLLAAEGKEDGRLKVSDIFALNLKADMVVLSACETGLGKNNSGDEIIGLTRAFIYAGTPSVITTLWKVNDRASYELMREFYSNLKTNKKSEALRQAQLKTMQEFPEPFFWAAYGLTGEP